MSTNAVQMTQIKRLFLLAVGVILLRLFFFYTDSFSFEFKRTAMLVTIHFMLFFGYFMVIQLFKTKSEAGLKVASMVLTLMAIFASGDFIYFYGNMAIFASGLFLYVSVAIATVLFAVLLFKKVVNGTGIHKLAFLVILSVQAVLTAHVVNIDLDFSEPTTTVFQIKNKEAADQGDSTNYRLDIDDNLFKHVYVDSKTYTEIRTSGILVLNIKKGFLGHPWIAKINIP
jgi:hypothetical protein